MNSVDTRVPNRVSKHGFSLRKPWYLFITLLISYSFVNLFMLFVVQHLVSPHALIPMTVVLTGATIWVVQHIVSSVTEYLFVLPPWLRVSFVFLMLLCGMMFFFLGPVEIPDNIVLRENGFPSNIELISKLVTVGTVGAFGLATLLTKTIGKEEPRILRFLAVTLFFTGYLIVGLFIYDDYGISVDEHAQRRHSIITSNYIAQQIDPELAQNLFGNQRDLSTYSRKFYPVAFQIPLTFIEALNNFQDDVRDIWLYRHYSTFLFYFCGVVAFYRLVYEKFSSWKLGLIGAFFLVVTPHLFPQSFTNIKDPVFLSAFAIALYLAFRYWRHKTISSALLFGAFTAFASNIRIVAFFLIPFALIFVLLDIANASSEKPRVPSRKQMFTSIGILLMTYLTLQVLFFPATWSDPVRLNIEALLFFSDYTAWDGRITYMGEWIRGQEVPWHYLPVWMGITIPLTYQILFGIGCLLTIRLIIQRHIHLLYDDKREEVGFLVLFLLPIIALILLNSTMYGDWRQFYFLYIPFLMIVMYAIRVLGKIYITRPSGSTIKRLLLVCFICLGFYQVYLLHWMIINHPYQNMFTTTPIVELFGGREAFDRERGRLSVYQGFKFIASVDPSDSITVCTVNSASGNTIEILETEDRERIHWIDNCQGAQYMINNYRYPNAVFNIVANKLPIFTATVDGLTILSVYRID